MPALKASFALICLLALSVSGQAHLLFNEVPAPQTPSELARAWTFEPGVLALLLPLAWLYARGLRRMRPAGAYRRESLCFALGWLSLAASLLSPLHALGHALFSAHMLQHEILMLIAAPLLVLGRPLVPILRALPRPWAIRLARGWHASRLGTVVSGLMHPFSAWSIHAIALWAWHVPALFAWTVSSTPIHTLQHLSFFGSALLFWWAVFHGPQRHHGYGAAVLYLFTTALHTTVLGVLLTFSRKPWYAPYLETTTAWNLTPLEDQQLGGLIMWVPAGVVYIIAALALFAMWLRASEARPVIRGDLAASSPR